MPTIAIVDGVVLMIYPRDHLPPHLHARYAEHRCKISIVTGDLIEGRMPKSKLRSVKAWLADRRPKVAFAWDEIQAGQPLRGLIE